MEVTVVISPAAIAAEILQSPVAYKVRMLVHTAVPVLDIPDADVIDLGNFISV